MSSTIRNAKQSVSIQDTAAERRSRLYVDVRASYGRAAIQAALLLNGAASVALFAFLGNSRSPLASWSNWPMARISREAWCLG